MADGAFAIALLGLLQISFVFGVRTTVFQSLPIFLTDDIRAIGMEPDSLGFIVFDGTMNDVVPTILEYLGASTFLLFSLIEIVLPLGSGLALHTRTVQ